MEGPNRFTVPARVEFTCCGCNKPIVWDDMLMYPYEVHAARVTPARHVCDSCQADDDEVRFAIP